MATISKKAQGHGNITVFIILLILAASIIFYVISLTPAQKEEFLGYDVTAYTSKVLDENPGLLQGISEDDLDIETYSFPIITVDYAPEKTSTILDSDLKVKKSVTSDSSEEYQFKIAKANLDTATLTFKVIDREGTGSLIIILNENTIFDSLVNINTDEEINIPLDLILDGLNNLEVHASSSGKFWQTNTYTISDLTINLGEYTGVNAVKTQTFTLTNYELGNFVKAKYQVFIKQEAEQANLNLELNGKIIYNEIPNDETRLVLDTPKSMLKSSNTLTWTVAKDGVYSIEFGKFVVTTAPTSNFKSYTFNIGSTIYNRATLGQYECLLTVSKKGGKGVNVNLNGDILSFDLTQGTETKTVCGYLVEGSNSLIVSAREGDVVLDQLTLIIQSK